MYTPKGSRVGRRTAGRLGTHGPTTWDGDKFLRAVNRVHQSFEESALNISSEERSSEIIFKPNARTEPAVDKRYVGGLPAGQEAVFLPGHQPVDRLLVFGSKNRSHARHVRKKDSTGTHKAHLVPLINQPGIDKIVLVLANGETIRRLFLGALAGMRGAFLLGKSFCRRPAPRGPAPPTRRAPELCPGFGFHRFKWNIACFCFRRNVKGNCFRCSGENE